MKGMRDASMANHTVNFSAWLRRECVGGQVLVMPVPDVGHKIGGFVILRPGRFQRFARHEGRPCEGAYGAKNTLGMDKPASGKPADSRSRSC